MLLHLFAVQTASVDKSGKIPNYIPILAKVDPEQFGVSICTVDGQRFNQGELRLSLPPSSLSLLLGIDQLLYRHRHIITISFFFRRHRCLFRGAKLHETFELRHCFGNQRVRQSV